MTDAATFIKTWEGLRLKAYQDSVGVWTVGYGHTGIDVTPDMVITHEQADTMLDNDIARARALIVQYIQVALTENQMIALLSLVFNCGVAPLTGTLGHLLNAGDYSTAALQFSRWCHAGGKVLAGLERRRSAEQKLFNTPEDNATG